LLGELDLSHLFFDNQKLFENRFFFLHRPNFLLLFAFDFWLLLNNRGSLLDGRLNLGNNRFYPYFWFGCDDLLDDFFHLDNRFLYLLNLVLAFRWDFLFFKFFLLFLPCLLYLIVKGEAASKNKKSDPEKRADEHWIVHRAILEDFHY
jgi:hypothetical protein